VVWDEAENRLHVQKAILAWCLSASATGTAGSAAGEERANARLRRVERAGAK
jgi:hypothetical protein